MDNTTPHPLLLLENLWTLILYMPAHTTVKLQPLHAGIIKNFKVHYWELLLCHIISWIEAALVHLNDFNNKSVDLLTDINWIKESVQSTTTVNCLNTVKRFQMYLLMNKMRIHMLDWARNWEWTCLSQIQDNICAVHWQWSYYHFYFWWSRKVEEELHDEVRSETCLSLARKQH